MHLLPQHPTQHLSCYDFYQFLAVSVRLLLLFRLTILGTPQATFTRLFRRLLVPPRIFQSIPTISSALLRFLVHCYDFQSIATISRAIFVLSSPSPRLLDHFRGLYSGFLVFTSYQIPSHLVYRDPSRLTANIY